MKHKKKYHRETIVNALDDKKIYIELDLITMAYLALQMQKKSAVDVSELELSSLFNDKEQLLKLKEIANSEWKNISKLAKEVDEDVLTEFIICSFETNLYAGMTGLPSELIKLSNGILGIEKNDSVIDLLANDLTYLIETGNSHPNLKLLGVTRSKSTYYSAQIKDKLLPFDLEIVIGNTLNLSPPKKANKVFAFPPFMQRLGQFEHEFKDNPKLSALISTLSKNTRTDWLYPIVAHQYLKDKNSKAVLLVSVSTAFSNTKYDMAIKEMLVDNGMLEAVILLPEKLLPSTNISLLLLVVSMNNDKIRFIDASNEYTKVRMYNTLSKDNITAIMQLLKKDADNSKLISNTEVVTKDYSLSPQTYQMTKIKLPYATALKDIASIRRGAIFNSKKLDKLSSNEPTDIKYLMLSNIKDGTVDKQLPYLKPSEDISEKNCIYNEQLIMSKMLPFKFAVARKNANEKILANGNLYLLDIDTKVVNPYFLQLFLESKKGQTQLIQLSKGAAQKTINIKDLMSVKIPLIPLSEQEEIVQRYLDIRKQETLLTTQIELLQENRAKLIDEVL